jgi:minor extracellular protease Epr
MRFLSPAFLLTLALAVPGLPLAPPTGVGVSALPGLTALAWADDDDDDDDGGSSSSGRSGFSGGGERWRPFERQRQRSSQRAPAPRVQPPPAFAPEIVVRDLAPDDLVILLAEGFVLIQALALPGEIGTLTRLAPPQGTTLEAGRTRVRGLASGLDADFNHYYRAGQGAEAPRPARPLAAAQPAPTPCRHANCAAWDLVGWPAARADLPGCAVTLPVGVIDTGVNPDHDLLTGARLAVVRLADEGQPPSRAVHGTAVVSLLIGTGADRVSGLIPEAEVIAADIFSRAGTDERADVVALIRGLEEMAARGVRVVNLSLAGPPNAVLDLTLARLIGQTGMLIVAAVGNGGPQAEPAYPAAHPGVLAVTAVDGRMRIYGAAQRGAHVDLAAPGVNLLTATSVRGARAQTGTSFAVPFVTATAAVLMSRHPTWTAGDVLTWLRDNARDLGAEGPDEMFGRGLLSAAALCD